MKIIIIDNGTRFLEQLTAMAASGEEDEVLIMKFTEIDFSKINDCDLIVLSGGHTLGVVNHDAEYADELKLIRESAKPILGICMGCELIAYAFDSRLELLEKPERETVELRALEENPIAILLSNAKVHESHKWYIKELGIELKALAKSKDGVEIIKHKNLPIYGLQFHPELDPVLGKAVLKLIKN